MPQPRHVPRVRCSRPHILLLHEGPSGGEKQIGHPVISEIIEGNQIPLTICGHKHWTEPMHRTSSGIV